MGSKPTPLIIYTGNPPNPVGTVNPPCGLLNPPTEPKPVSKLVAIDVEDAELFLIAFSFLSSKFAHLKAKPCLTDS